MVAYISQPVHAQVNERLCNTTHSQYSGVDVGLRCIIWTLPPTNVLKANFNVALEALKRMKLRKVVGPDGIPIEIWRCLGEVGVGWLTNLFNKI